MMNRDPKENLRDLPLVKAPDSLWTSLDSALTSGEKPQAVLPFPVRRYAASSAIAATLVLSAGLFWRFHQASKPHWEVARTSGTPRMSSWLGSQPLPATGQIAEGQWLQTDSNSSASIEVGDIGTVHVDPNTRVRLVVAHANEHRLSLAHGRISAVVNAPPRLFFVDTPASTAVDLGCAYAMNVDDAGNGLLQVTLGWVSLEWSGRESLVPAGASCRTRPKVGPGTPYFDDAPDLLKQALNDLDFQPVKDGALDTILDQARVRDTLTLWHLLSRVNPSDRLRVYNRIVALVPLPAAISPEKALQLDPDTLKHWKEELAWKW